MRRFELTTLLEAAPERVFDLSLSVDVHTASMRDSGERVVGGVRRGVLGPGDEVTWQARHLGRSWRMTSRITAHVRPTSFVDTQVSGPFATWHHAHYFEPTPEGGTRMRDVIEYAAPYWLLGRLAERLVLDRYLAGLIRKRNEHLVTICHP